MVRWRFGMDDNDDNGGGNGDGDDDDDEVVFEVRVVVSTFVVMG